MTTRINVRQFRGEVFAAPERASQRSTRARAVDPAPATKTHDHLRKHRHRRTRT